MTVMINSSWNRLNDYQERRGIDGKIHDIDRTTVFWRVPA
jgi:hypothetical protein